MPASPRRSCGRSATRDPAVRRAAALALGRVGGDGAAEHARERLQARREGDVFLKDGYVRGLERLGKPGIDALLSLAASGDKERDLAVEAFLALRTQAGADALPELLLRPGHHRRPARSAGPVVHELPVRPAAIARPARRRTSRRRPNESLDGASRAAVEVFALSGDANAQKATQYRPRPARRTRTTTRGSRRSRRSRTRGWPRLHRQLIEILADSDRGASRSAPRS